MPSPLVASTRPEQVEVPGMKSQSNQLRRSLTCTIGLYRVATSVACAAMYLLALNFSAVFALPNRSYTAPKRGTMFDHVGRFATTPSYTRAGTKRPGAATVARLATLS